MRLFLAFSAFGVSDGVSSKSSGSSGLQSSLGKSPKWKFFGTKYHKMDKRSKEQGLHGLGQSDSYEGLQWTVLVPASTRGDFCSLHLRTDAYAFLRGSCTAIRSRPESPGKEYKEARVDSKIENEIKKYISENSREEVRENLELNFSKTKYLMKEGLGRFSK